MTPQDVVTFGNEALMILIVIVAVILLPALGVGLLVAIFQAATQINEQTMSFIPKLLVTFLVIMFAGPWMLKVMTEYFSALILNIPILIG